MNGVGYGITPFMGTHGILARSSGGGGGAFVNEYSMSFDGMTDYLIIPDNDNLSFGDGVTDSPFSISAWIKPNSTGVSFPIINKLFATGSRDEWELRVTGIDTIRFVLYQNDIVTRRGRDTTVQTTALQGWCHIVGTYDGRGGTTAYDGIKIYVNGVRADNTNYTKNVYTAMNNTTSSVKIGYHDDFAILSNGLIDEVAIFNSELSASDVTTIYNGGTPNDLTSLSPLSWWRMGDGDTWNGSSWILTDNGSGGNDASSNTTMPEEARTTDIP